MKLQIIIEQKKGEVICSLGTDHCITGRGKSVTKALVDLSKRVDAAVHGKLSCSLHLVERLVELNKEAEQYLPDFKGYDV